MRTLINPLFLISILSAFIFVACDTQTSGTSSLDTREVEITIKDIRGDRIVYDFYQVRKKDQMDYISTEVANADGQTVVRLEIDKNVNNVIVKRTRKGVEKRQVVPLNSDRVSVQFLL